MLRGFTTFFCSECGKRFMGADIEWNATALSTPLECPHCGSWHTRPWSLLPAKIANQRYIHLWEKLDKNNTNQ